MKFSRRGVLGLFGGAAAAGPAVVAKGSSQMGALDVSSVGLLSEMANGDSFAPGDSKTFAIKQIAKRKLFGLVDWQKRKSKFIIHRLDVDTASLRSVSLGSKMRISRDRQWRASEEREDDWLARLAAGDEY